MASAEKDKLGADLSAYLDGELSPERAREVEQLLAESEDARRTLASLRMIAESLASLPRTHAPHGLRRSVSHDPERQALLQERPPAGRARLLRLFGRISASAAVIAACAFAGWTVVQRVNQPGVSGTELATTRAEPRVTDEVSTERFARRSLRDASSGGKGPPRDADGHEPDPPAIAVKETLVQLEALGYVGESEPELVQADEAPAEEVITLGDEVVALAVEVPRALGEIAAPSDQRLAFLASSEVDVAPAVCVVVTPRDMGEFNGTLDTVASWQRTPVDADGQTMADRVAEGRRERESDPRAAAVRECVSGAPTRQDFTVEVSESRVYAFLASLDERAPGQVQAAVNFNARDISQVQRMVMSPEAEPDLDSAVFAGGEPTSPAPPAARARADAPAEEDGFALSGGKAHGAKRGAGRGGSRGSIMRNQEIPESETEAETARAAGAKRIEAHPLPEALETGRLQRSKARRDISDLDDAKELKTGLVADNKMESSDQRHPRVEHVAARVPTQPAALVPREKLGLASPGQPAERRTKPATTQTAQPPRSAVRLRVTLLPPPVTTQPESQPSADGDAPATRSP